MYAGRDGAQAGSIRGGAERESRASDSPGRSGPSSYVLAAHDPHATPIGERLRCAEPVLAYLAEDAGSTLNRGVSEAVARVLRASEATNETHAALRAAFLARALNGLADVLAELDDAALGRAAGAGSGRAVLLAALEPVSAGSLAPDGDPLMVARLRGLKARDQILGAEGGTLPASRVAEHLRISRQAVDKRRRSGKLVGLDIGRHGHAYPAWQFDERGVLPGLEAILAALRVGDPWMQAAFFLSGDPRLDGDTPLDQLRRGRLEAVVRAARGYGQHGGA